MCGVCMGSFCSRMTHSLFLNTVWSSMFNAVSVYRGAQPCCHCLGGGFPWGLCWGADCTPWQCCLRAALILGCPRSLGLGCCSLWEVDSVEQTLLDGERGEFLYVPCCEAVLGMIHCVKMHFSSDFQQQYNGAPPLICGAQQKVINGNDDTVEERRR